MVKLEDLGQVAPECKAELARIALNALDDRRKLPVRTQLHAIELVLARTDPEPQRGVDPGRDRPLAITVIAAAVAQACGKCGAGGEPHAHGGGIRVISGNGHESNGHADP